MAFPLKMDSGSYVRLPNLPTGTTSHGGASSVRSEQEIDELCDRGDEACVDHHEVFVWLGRASLTDGAVATSRLTGTLVDPGACIGHIFDPAGRRGTLRSEPVTVLHESAAVADAVSTAAVVMEDRHLHLLDRLDAKIIRGDLNRI